MAYEVAVRGHHHVYISDDEADSVEEARELAQERAEMPNIDSMDVFEYDEE